MPSYNSNYGGRSGGYGYTSQPKPSQPLQPEGLDTAAKNSINIIISADNSAKTLVEFAEKTADRLIRDRMTTSQVRNTFGEVRKIEAFWDKAPEDSKRRLRLLQPKLAYQKARDKKTAYFCEVMNEAVRDVFLASETDKAFHNFLNLMEAIVAYHKAKGGRD